MPTPKPIRRWFQFRLRALLVGVVLLGSACSYVAHEWQIVAARKEWLKNRIWGASDIIDLTPRIELTEPSWIRRMMGDKVRPYVFHCRPEDLVAAEALFPEASFLPWPLPPTTADWESTQK